jgi:hypothetical protein
MTVVFVARPPRADFWRSSRTQLRLRAVVSLRVNLGEFGAAPRLSASSSMNAKTVFFNNRHMGPARDRFFASG